MVVVRCARIAGFAVRVQIRTPRVLRTERRRRVALYLLAATVVISCVNIAGVDIRAPRVLRTERRRRVALHLLTATVVISCANIAGLDIWPLRLF
jgi:hypothetical protein